MLFLSKVVSYRYPKIIIVIVPGVPPRPANLWFTGSGIARPAMGCRQFACLQEEIVSAASPKEGRIGNKAVIVVEMWILWKTGIFPGKPGFFCPRPFSGRWTAPVEIPGRPPAVLHSPQFIVEARCAAAQPYLALMLVLMSLTISSVFGSSLHSFSTRLMELRMVEWSRSPNSLPMSFRESLVICRVR